MKKLLSVFILAIFFVFITASVNIYAQEETNVKIENEDFIISQGTVEISANFTGSMFGVATIPSIGYSITDNIQVSGGMHYETGTMDDLDYDAFGVSFFGLYNFYPKSVKRLVPFVQLGFNIASFEIESIDVVDSTGFVFGGGARYFVTDNFSVNGIINYQTGDMEYTRFGIGVSVFIF